MARHKPCRGQRELFTAVTEEVIQEPGIPDGKELPTTVLSNNAYSAANAEFDVKRGDLYKIGRHRLLCGDSASISDVSRLRGGPELNPTRVQLVHTDPPYNVKVQPQSKKDGATARKLEGDFISDDRFRKLLDRWFFNIESSLEPSGAFYIWGGYSNLTNYPPAIKYAGLYYSQAIIWVKSMSVFTRKDFMGKHEIAFYGWKEIKGKGKHKFCGPNNVTDVWEIKNVPRQDMIHLTEKPVEIPLRAIECSSNPGDIVLDLFGGSGSTLVAAEQSDRICYLMEIDEWYCNIILKRCKDMGLVIERITQ